MSHSKKHFSPIFANKNWALNKLLTQIYKSKEGLVIEDAGYTKWGIAPSKWSKEIEVRLNQELETQASLIYQKLLKLNPINDSEKKIWARFLLSQLVRTPTYIKYESEVKTHPDSIKAKNDRIGCEECFDINFLLCRDWVLLEAYENEGFVRTDNPILQTSFIELPETVLYYPLSPNICFVATSMIKDLYEFDRHEPNIYYQKLNKSDSICLNFYLIRSASDRILIPPDQCNVDVITKISSEMLGIYPQPPFSLHYTAYMDKAEHHESIRKIMSKVDNVNYEKWECRELTPFYIK